MDSFNAVMSFWVIFSSFVLVFCYCMFHVISLLLQWTVLSKSSVATSKQVANYLVSGARALLAFSVGCVVISNTSSDIIYDRHWLMDVYPWIGMGYGIYDLWCMVHVYQAKHTKYNTFLHTLPHAIRARLSVVIHHVWLMIFGFPVVLYLRNGKGDFLIACVHMMECSSPFIQLRAILSELNMKDTTVYWVNGIVMIVAHFFSRVLIFPYMFWCYAQYVNVPLWKTLFVLPQVCIFGSLFLWSLQLYWLVMMVYGAKRIIYDRDYTNVDYNYGSVKMAKST